MTFSILAISILAIIGMVHLIEKAIPTEQDQILRTINTELRRLHYELEESRVNKSEFAYNKIFSEIQKLNSSLVKLAENEEIVNERTQSN